MSFSSGDSVWAGVAVASGAVEIYGTVGGINATAASTTIAVRARGDWGDAFPDFVINELGSSPDLAIDPGNAEGLGGTWNDVVVPSSSWTTVAGGPNAGAAYMTDIYTESLRIEINNAALASGSAFVNRYPTTTTADTCSQSYVEGLRPTIEAHEGTAWQSISHAGAYYDLMSDVSSFGNAMEAIVDPGGAVSGSDVLVAMGTNRSNAWTSSITYADSHPPTLSCYLKFHP
jgi:hypothetical protein